MRPALLACLLFALLIIIARGPLIFAPEATISFYMSYIFGNPLRIRLMGVLVLGIGAFLLATMSGLQQTFTVIMFLLGLLLVLGGLFIVAAPGFVKEFVSLMLSVFSPTGLRLIGLLSVAVAFLISYFAIITFGALAP